MPDHSPPLQFPLPLKLDADASLDNFWCRKDSVLLNVLRDAVHQPGEQWVVVSGVAGTGKSHLLQGLVHYAEKQGLAAAYIDCAELLSLHDGQSGEEAAVESEDLATALFEGFEQYALIAIDNLHVFAGRAVWERALFNLLVALRQTMTSKLIMAANNSIDALGFQLPDLSSRLNSAARYQIAQYSDEEKVNILMHRAQAEGMEMSLDVARYITQRHARDMQSLTGCLKQLARMTLARRRKLTIPFVRDILVGK